MKIRRGIAALLACVVTPAMILVATPLAARADDPSTSGPLINTGSAMCFEPIPQGSDVAGLPIQQRPCGPSVIRPDGSANPPSQFYQFLSQGFVAFNDQSWCHFLGCITDGRTGFLIQNLGTGLCLDVRDGSKSDGAVVQQWTCKGDARSMLWYVDSDDFPGMFKLKNFNSDKCLDVKGGSSDEFAQLQQYHCTSINLAQNFSQKVPQNWPAADLPGINGRWTDGSTRSAVIYEGLGSIIIDMSAFNRPAARGRVLGCGIHVTFPDNATFFGEASPCFNPDQACCTSIKWDNGSIWTKKP